MKYSLCFLAIFFILLTSCKDKLIISDDQNKSFQKFYGNVFQDNGDDVKTIPVSSSFPNGGYAVAGYTYNDSAGLKVDKDMLFLILDQYGNIVGKPKKFGGPKDDEARRVYLLPGGTGFLLVGYTTKASQRRAYVIKLNATGTDTVWTWKSNIWESSAEEAYAAYIDSVQNIYTVVGYQTLSNQQNGWIFNLDAQGNYDSTSTGLYSPGQFKSYPAPNALFNDIGILSANSICIQGTFSAPTSLSQPVPLNRSIVFTAFKQGNYTIKYNNADIIHKQDLSEYSRQVIILPDSKAAYLSSTDTFDQATHSTHSVHISIFDKPATPTSSPIINWYFFDGQNNINGGSLDAARMVYLPDENNFVVAATLVPATSTVNSFIVLIKVDGSTGNEIWRRTFGNIDNYKDNYSASGLDLAPDVGFIITGFNNTGGFNQSVLIIKTDLDGLIH